MAACCAESAAAMAAACEVLREAEQFSRREECLASPEELVDPASIAPSPGISPVSSDDEASRPSTPCAGSVAQLLEPSAPAVVVDSALLAAIAELMASEAAARLLISRADRVARLSLTSERKVDIHSRVNAAPRYLRRAPLSPSHVPLPHAPSTPSLSPWDPARPAPRPSLRRGSCYGPDSTPAAAGGGGMCGVEMLPSVSFSASACGSDDASQDPPSGPRCRIAPTAAVWAPESCEHEPCAAERSAYWAGVVRRAPAMQLHITEMWHTYGKDTAADPADAWHAHAETCAFSEDLFVAMCDARRAVVVEEAVAHRQLVRLAALGPAGPTMALVRSVLSGLW